MKNTKFPDIDNDNSREYKNSIPSMEVVKYVIFGLGMAFLLGIIF